MSSLKSLLISETRTSMLFLASSIVIVVSSILIFNHYLKLKSDVELLESFIRKTTQNALVLDQPFLLQRSISEFWSAFGKAETAVSGLDVFLDGALISQVGTDSVKNNFWSFKKKSCHNTSLSPICIEYVLEPFYFLKQTLIIFLSVIFSTSFAYYVRRRVAEGHINKIISPLEREISRLIGLASGSDVKSKIQLSSLANATPAKESLAIVEIQKLSAAYSHLLEQNIKYLELNSSIEISRSMSGLASQVAHDIRSPLTVLNMAIHGLNSISEEQRLLVRAAANRINDIANSLLLKSRELEPKSTPPIQHKFDMVSDKSISLLPAIVDAIVSEKRIQYRGKARVDIEAHYVDAYCAFAPIIPGELKRVLSNLINNAVEALPADAGQVTVSVNIANESLSIEVRDNGRGIPPEIVRVLGQRGVTHGKEIFGVESGSGLGVYHAKKTIESSGGTFHVASRLNFGTTITIELPPVKAPIWFAESIALRAETTVISIDDDRSVHEIWKRRLNKSETGEKDIKHLSFTSCNEFRVWFQNNVVPNHKALFSDLVYLIDYEFIGEKMNGLDLVAELEIASKAVIVTSHFEDPALQIRAEELGVTIIPKAMAVMVPIHFMPS